MFQKLKLFALVCVVPCFGFNLDEMSLEEKVGQLLMVHFHGEVANEDAKILIQETKVGGIIYYNWSNGLSSPEQVHTLSSGLQKLARESRTSIPLLIAADQEGGLVVRLTRGFTIFPGNKALGMTGESRLAELAALCMGEEMKAVGINMNLAPVVDINCNPKNPVIGIRSFGEVPETVVAFGEKALRGYKEAGIIGTLKHFPGHGDVEVDSHEDLPVIHKSIEQLEQVELLPFRKLAPLADAIMTAHLMVPALDPDNCVTLSKKAHSYLREKIAFQGLIVSDSLVMEGVLKKCHSVDEAALQTLEAGCDMLILGGKQLIGSHANLELTVADIQRIHASLVKAVKSGRVSEARINEAVQRVLKLKERYVAPVAFEAFSTYTKQHPAVAQKIASLALRVIEKKKVKLHEKTIALIAPQLLKESIDQASLLKIGKQRQLFFFNGLSPSAAEIESLQQSVQATDVVVFFSYNAWKNPSQALLIQSLLDKGKQLILLVTRDSLDGTLFPQADMIYNTFGPTLPSIQAVCDRLELYTNPNK